MGSGRGKGTFSGYGCIKYLFFIFNVIFWLLGCALLGVGIWLHVSNGAYAMIAPNYRWLSLTSICMVAGAVIILLGFFGCCGAIMENQCMLILYFILVVCIFILEVTAIVLAFIHHQKIDQFLKEELTAGVKGKQNPGVKEAWDSIQKDMECCGVVSYSDWFGSERWNPDEQTYGPDELTPNPEPMEIVPESCCRLGNCPTSIETGGNATMWFDVGCYKGVQTTLDNHMEVVVVVGVIVGILQVLGLVASMVLFCYLRSEKYDEYMPSDQY